MKSLYEIITAHVNAWREAEYDGSEFPAISEILEYQVEMETASRRFLRTPQIHALETYWYLRLIQKTPVVIELYRQLYPRKTDLIAALGVQKAFEAVDFDMDALWARILSDDRFVKDFKLEALRESLALAYPSYILALAMGAGKTILIGTIIATEFAMAMEYPDGPFVQNAMVFAPGKTILESLRQMARAPYDKILPPRMYKPFAANLKLTFTRDGDPDIPVIRGSVFNIVVTNTEKIRIRKESIRKADLGQQLALPLKEEEAARAEVANRRLQTIASLPHLAVFSDEAHHTYGQSMGTDLKRVRQTVDYLHATSPNLVCVVNTTGTPFFGRQPLKDVVTWYGLSQGIADGILKDVSGSIFGYDFDPSHTDDFVREVITDFFRTYGEVRLPDGSPARLAIYFPQNDDLDQVRPVIETALMAIGRTPDLVLRNTSAAGQTEIDAFNRLNDPSAPHRVILLVNKGTEGWDCPSLFACALARKLKSSNNFVLQAATRCLRQVPGNAIKRVSTSPWTTGRFSTGSSRKPTVKPLPTWIAPAVNRARQS